MSRQVSLYRGLLRVYPSAFRDEYGEEMTRLFAEQLADARSAGRPSAVPALWIRIVIDLASTAPRQHVRRERQMAQPTEGPVVEVEPARHANRVPRMVLGLLPIWAFVAHRLMVPAYKDPFFAKPPEAVGLPLGVVALGLALCLMASGIAVLLRTDSRCIGVLALVLATVPATALVALTPWIIVEMMRLHA
jgi:hypothetical protein